MKNWKLWMAVGRRHRGWIRGRKCNSRAADETRAGLRRGGAGYNGPGRLSAIRGEVIGDRGGAWRRVLDSRRQSDAP